jgi:hypothetical protein
MLVFTGSYLGGHPAREHAEKSATLKIETEGVKVSVFRTFIDEPWENITALDVEVPIKSRRGLPRRASY